MTAERVPPPTSPGIPVGDPGGVCRRCGLSAGTLIPDEQTLAEGVPGLQFERDYGATRLQRHAPGQECHTGSDALDAFYALGDRHGRNDAGLPKGGAVRTDVRCAFGRSKEHLLATIHPVAAGYLLVALWDSGRRDRLIDGVKLQTLSFTRVDPYLLRDDGALLYAVKCDCREYNLVDAALVGAARTALTAGRRKARVYAGSVVLPR